MLKHFISKQKPKYKKGPWTEQELVRGRFLKDSGMSTRKVAECLNRSHTCVYKVLWKGKVD